MERICPRCGKSLQENDFLCPDCGAIYEAPADEEAKEETSSSVTQRRNRRHVVMACVIALLAVIVCVMVWDSFRSDEPLPTEMPMLQHSSTPFATTTELPTTPTTVPLTVPTTVQPTNPKPTFDPAALAAEIPEDVLLQMKQAALDQYRLLFYEVEDVTIARAFGIFEDGKYAVIIDDVSKHKWEREQDKEYGMTFLYPDKNAIRVYQAGEFTDLWSLTMEEAAVVFENYYNAYPHIPKPEPELYIPPCDPFAMAAQIPEDVQQQIIQAYVDMTTTADAADEYKLEAYGIFPNAYAVDFIWLAGGGFGQGPVTINGLAFYDTPWIFAHGMLYSLADAFAQQIITAEELQLIHTNVYGVNTH